MSKLNIVCGVPRSGTSMTMELMRLTFGDDRILGSKFPRESRAEDKFPGETDEVYSYRMALQELKKEQNKDKNEKSKDLNPNGFWEMPFTVAGIRYSLTYSDLFKKINSSKEPLICKIVSQGLPTSDPGYINKIIYLLRDPASVSKSQERLERELMVKLPGSDETIDFWEGAQIIEPRMFITVSIQAAQWFKANPEVPVLFVKYLDIVQKPEETLRKMQDFLGEGDFTQAIDSIEVKLNRSTGHELDHPLAEEANQVYEMMCKQDWDGIIEYAIAKDTERSKETVQWTCLRRGVTTNTMLCELCKSDKLMMESFKKAAEEMGIDWENKPCGFDCGIGNNPNKPITADESIKNNHWRK